MGNRPRVKPRELRGWRGQIGWWLRCLADRLDHEHATKLIHWSFTFEHGQGVKFREDGRGCPLAYIDGEWNYHRAHTDADRPTPKINWDSMTVSYPPDYERPNQ